MPFGKFKGRRLTDLPDAYVEWLLAIDLHEPLRSAVFAEAVARGLVGASPAASPIRPPRAAELVELGFRTAARRYHPDVGGTNEAMREILAARDWLRDLVGAR